ncbi:MAG: DEAD/DEAH box helicase family protein, partial [Candidatus Acidiferrales bacterium]
MPLPKEIDSIATYLRAWAPELGERILQTYPPLHGFDDAASPLTRQLLRKPFPAQTLAMMGVVKRWNEARGAAVIAECGTGKTLISLGAVHVHSDHKPFTALAMVPPQLVEKWAREAFLTLPRVRVFFIDGLRTPTSSAGHAGVNEVRLRHDRIVREGLRTTLTELRLRKMACTVRQRWDSICGFPALFIVGRERGKLSYFWRHAYGHARCGRYQGSIVNSDTGCPIYLGEDGERLLSADFRKAKLSEILGAQNGDESAKLRRALYSALWQADGTKTRRFAPVDFIGRYMPDFFDYAIADEVHELKGDTAQGNALGTLAACAQRTVVLTGTLLG